VDSRPRFFCEHCGAEVKRNADRCSACGKFFSSVRCPKCGFVGAEDLFSDGCPVCGYSAGRRNGPDRGGAAPGGAARQSAGGLPLWVYLLTIGCAILVVLSALAVLR